MEPRRNPGTELPDGMSALAVRAQVEKIAGSKGFLASERMGRLLRFVVEETLRGNAERLKEYPLGVEVFDRSVDFDPRTDPIVRVEARRLRAKLKEYYQGDGSTDDVVIEVPTGGYVPRVERRGAPRVAAAPAGCAATIAVLPFSNLSSEPDSDYFSDGLTEEIIHALTKVEGLTVVAWNSAARLKDEQGDVVGIGKRLRAGTVLQGSVRRSGDRVRILVKLVETSAGHIRWSETYDRRVEDLFAIQEDISRRVADNLRTKLFGGRSVEGPIRQWQLPAYDLYLRGRFHWNKRTAEGFRRAVECFSDAVASDAEFAPGYAGLADTYALMAQKGVAAPWEVIPLAKEAALKALALDGDLAEALASLALIQSLAEWKWEEAGKHYLRSIAIQPGYATAHHWYAGDFLALLGRFEEAAAHMDTAARLDPLSPVIANSLGYVALLAGRMDDAIAAQRLALDLDPHYAAAVTTIARAYLHQGKTALAVEMFEKGRQMAGDTPALLGALAQAYAMNGESTAARALIGVLNQIGQERFVQCTALALAHTGLGEKDRALDWLELGCERHELSVSSIAVHPGYDRLRGESRFEALVERMGLHRSITT